MNTIGAVIVWLIASGACVDVPFRGEDGSRVMVLICPRFIPAPPAPSPSPAPDESTDPPPAPGAPERHT